MSTARIIQFPDRRQAQLVDVRGLVAAFGMSERWWRYRMAEGLPCKRWGKRLRFSVEEVEAWLEQRYRDG